jgi:hypothetical protein
MGYNAGGYGTMTFPNEGAVTEWKKTTVSHGAFDDWIDELEWGTYQEDETVAKRLASIAKNHDAKSFLVQQVGIEGPRVTLTWDTGEDNFRETVGDFAALVRSAEAFKAKGAFYFLGTAGAEGDFAYSVVLDGKGGSTVAKLAPNKIMKVAYGADYEAYAERVSALMEADLPAIKKMMTQYRDGAAPSKRGNRLHKEVVACLEDFSDAQLAKTVAKYPALVPGGKGLTWAKDVYKAKTVREQFSSPSNEETRAAALWTLGELDPDAGTSLAFEVLEEKAPNEHLVDAALRVLAHAKHDDAEAALELAEQHLLKTKSVYVLSGAQAVLMKSGHGRLDAVLEKLLDKLPGDRGGYVVHVLKNRKRTKLAPALVRYAKRTKDHQAVELLAKWKVR